MRLVFALVVFALLAGCTKEEASPDSRTFSASGGKLSLGWAYDGVGVTPAGASLDGFVVDSTNSGSVNASFDLGGSKWVIRFDAFAEAPGKAFMDGGVKIDLDEHGDTGVADASIPKIHALAAAWGTARVTREGVLAAPLPYSAHLMLSGDTVRSADGRITKADGTTPYDPSTPSDAKRGEGDPQVILWIKHPNGETFSRPPADISASVSCQGPQCTQSAELTIEAGAESFDLNISTLGPAAQLPLGSLGQGRFAIVDANGTELSSGSIAPQPQGGAPSATGIVALKGAVLPLSLVVTGDGAFTVQAVGTANFGDVPFIVLTWDDVTFT